MQVEVQMHQLGDVGFLSPDESQELAETGSLRLVFPQAVVRFARVGNTVLQVLFSS